MTDETDFRMTHQGDVIDEPEAIAPRVDDPVNWPPEYLRQIVALSRQADLNGCAIKKLKAKLAIALDGLKRAQHLHRDKWIGDLLAQLEGENGGKT